MTLYLMGLAICTVIWAVATAICLANWHDHSGGRQGPKWAKRSRICLLCFFLIPIYPFAVPVFVIGVIIKTIKALNAEVRGERSN